MNRKQLGGSDLQVAPLTLGGNVFGWTIDEATSFKILDGFTGAGFNLIDTADVYSSWATGNKGGESETIIGNWMKDRGNRADVVLATKVGSDMGQGHTDLSKSYIFKAVEDSLRRLKTDYIDLYQTHWDDARTPVEETLEAYQELIKQGKVRWIGASNLSPERLTASLKAADAHGLPKYQSFQPHYNLVVRNQFEGALQDICLQNNLGVISYYSLASGFLTGKYRSADDLSKSARGGGVKEYLNDRGLGILTALDEIAAAHSTSVASVALAWLMTRPSVTAPIASATSMAQLDDLTAAANLSLSQDEIVLLDKASAH